MLKVTILERDEKPGSTALTLGFPDDSNTVTVTVDQGDDTEALTVGGQFSLAFVPYVPKTDPSAASIGATPGDAMLPVDHPLVMDPTDAALADSAEPPATDDSDDSDAADAGVSGN